MVLATAESHLVAESDPASSAHVWRADDSILIRIESLMIITLLSGLWIDNSDRHKDWAKKTIRDWGQEQVVFPQFYGSVYFQCAPNLLKGVMSGEKMPDGSTSKEYLASKGIKKLASPTATFTYPQSRITSAWRSGHLPADPDLGHRRRRQSRSSTPCSLHKFHISINGDLDRHVVVGPPCVVCTTTGRASRTLGAMTVIEVSLVVVYWLRVQGCAANQKHWRRARDTGRASDGEVSPALAQVGLTLSTTGFWSAKVSRRAADDRVELHPIIKRAPKQTGPAIRF